MDATKIRRGRAEHPEPLAQGAEIVKLRGCPDCDSRGYFLINPFIVRWESLLHFSNLTQCQTCLDCQTYWNLYNALPPEIVAELTAKD
ncbi:hypothetical protein [Aureliella helgolandensis]|uniref:Uncharacterized protein n=1 Tax=Aureliella helgolandensis TaxID=2527968 RepID=A0A518G759_9BACT|nr:hypothetical protein [Aureliella helgolandensis]QDV24416.1 hypothetical protein Q31a_27330 [Aureliella helgolandensis]